MTNLPTRQGENAPAGEQTAEEQAVIKAAGGWINLLARTLKTSRLYEAGNPTAVRFRQELAVSLGLLLERHGAMTFKITADDLLMGDVSLYPAKSREDNLALPFYRDGIHAITFHPGIEPRESDAFLDALLKVTGTSEGDDDLVTLLWEAQLDHIEMEYVPAESDLALGGPQEPATSPVPWPKGEEGTLETGAAEAPVDGGEGARSDDWSTGDLTIEVEAAFAELEALTATEGEAYLERHRREQQLPLVETAIAVANACLSTPVTQADMDELARFLPRALRRAVSEGEWRWAAETLHVLDRCQSREWSVETFAQEVMQPASVTAAIELVDAQDEDVVLEFITFAKALGEPAVDLLNLVMSESKVRRTRRLLAESVTELCRENPERLAPWLSDPRWYVVRNIIHILGWIGGPQIVGLLQAGARHPEPKVRHEVVAALGQLDLQYSRPLLLKMLEESDTRLFCLILHQLAARRDSSTARMLLGYLQDPAFDQRPIEEKRAIYSALATTGNDEILPELEAELHKGNWFTGTQETHRQAIARCIARFGTLASREVLEDGRQSRRSAVRRACEEALAGRPVHE